MTVAALTGALTVACSSTEPSAPAPMTLAAVTATTIKGTVGTQVTPPPAVRMIDQHGNPLQGVVITFYQSFDHVALGTSSARTDVDGVATGGGWTLGPVAGTYTMIARSAGLAVIFSATAAAGPVARIASVAGSDQRQPISTTLPFPLRVRVTDAFDNPLAGETVRFTIVSGGGSLAADSPVTDVYGVAISGAWTLGPVLGPQQVDARVGAEELAFMAEACDAAGCGSPPPHESMLAFVSERDGNSEIYVVNVDGTGLERLTNDPGRDEDPAWSPDGRRIAFTSSRAGGSDIYVMDADGSNLVRRTTEGLSEAPAWSPDGSRIAFSRLGAGQFSIYIMNVDGDWANPAHVGYVQGWNAHPAWSPDGTQIAFVSDWRAFDFLFDVYVMNADGSDIKSLLTGPFFWKDTLKFFFQPSWSPDGGRIAVVVCGYAQDNCYPNSQVAIANSDGSNLVTLATTGGFASPTWSPDASMIAYGVQSCRECPGSLRYASTDGRTDRLIFSNGHSPAWRP